MTVYQLLEFLLMYMVLCSVALIIASKVLP
jgi:hypothetical protein